MDISKIMDISVMGDGGSVPPSPKWKDVDNEKEIEEKVPISSSDSSEEEYKFIISYSSDSDEYEIEEEISPEEKTDEFFLDIDFDSDDEYWLPDGVKKADRKVWMKYYRQCYESEGYDIEDFPGACQMTEFVPVDDLNEDSSLCETLVKQLKPAISKYNDENEKAYEFMDLVKATASAGLGINYYVTFRLKNLKAGDEAPPELFQAKVWIGIGESGVELFRPRPERVKK